MGMLDKEEFRPNEALGGGGRGNLKFNWCCIILIV